MGLRALFDTNILVDYLNGVAAARDEIEHYEQALISPITWMEVMVGVLPEEETEVRGFLARFALVPITAQVSEAAVRLRREHRYKLPDAIILASAQVEGALLVTRNSRDFSPDAPGIRLPYQIPSG